MTDTIDIDAKDILLTSDNFNSENVSGALDELFGSFNEPNKIIKLDSNGTFDTSFLPSSTISNHLVSNQPNDKSSIETLINRIDKYIEQLRVTGIFYSNNEYLIEGDTQRPIKKLSYIEYGNNDNDPLVSLIYSNENKLIRVDYYLDRSTYISDGSGRSGVNNIIYNNLGKIESSVFTEL